jgi:tripartite-type tricarboxylate transporter receptor subunit TctC
MASFGTGSSSHLAGELFKSVAGVDMTHIPYRGSAPALADVIGGRVEVMFDTLLASLPHIRSGALRGLGLTGIDRSALVPDIPAIGETVPGYRAEAWNGVAVVRGTRPEIVDRLSREIIAGVADPTIRVRLAELATTPRPLGPAEFASFMAQETDKWAKLVKLSGARPE